MEKRRPETNFAVIAAQASVEAGETYTIHRIMNRVTPRILPVTLTTLVFFTIHSGGMGEFSLDKKILDPAGSEVFSLNGAKLPFKNGINACHHPWRINNMEFKQHGTYSFVALLDGEIVAVCPFEVAPK